jgi:hypothetical protein
MSAAAGEGARPDRATKGNQPGHATLSTTQDVYLRRLIVGQEA